MDKKTHAIFKDPVMGVRCFIEWVKIYTEGKERNLLQFFKQYAPEDDCIGSVKPVCRNGVCKCPDGANKPVQYAQKVAAALGIGILDPIRIRDEDGSLSVKFFTALMTQVAKVETGLDCRITEETIRLALAEL